MFNCTRIGRHIITAIVKYCFYADDLCFTSTSCIMFQEKTPSCQLTSYFKARTKLKTNALNCTVAPIDIIILYYISASTFQY